MMYRKYILPALCLVMTLALVACGGGEAETVPSADTETNAEIVEAATETEETEETSNAPSTFTQYKKLTVTEDTQWVDGALHIRFSDSGIRFLEQDVVAIGVSGGGEAWSMAGTLDLAASEAYKEGDTYTGVVVKPADELEATTYKFTVTIAGYLLAFSLNVG